ncbi:unnamed protein product [Camellia sinensis]
MQYRWMYFIERYLMTLKSYMRNRSHPEGSIAEGYLVEECMTFCSRYLDDVESKLNRPIRNYDVSDNPGILLGHALGKGKGFALDNTSWVQAHREHRDFIKRSHRRLKDFDVDRRHNDEFPRWFNSHVEELLAIENAVLSDEIKTLALGPSKKATRFNGYIINGTRYHTRSREWRRKTQNSGVMVKAKTCSYASTRDMNPVEGEVAYYGYVTDIIELYYSYDRRYVLFMCDWIDNNKGLKQDGFGFTLVNFNHLLYTKKQNSDEPFILASQAQQVFYVNDPVEADWDVVVKMKPRDLYEVCGEQPINDGEHHNEVEGFGDQELDATSFACEEDINWVRQGEVGTTIDETIGPLGISTQTQSEDDEEMQRQHSASANSESSYSGSADESSYSGSSDESSEESTRIIPDPPMSWYPPGSLPSTSSSTGSTHDTTAGHSSRGPTLMHGSDWNPSGGILHIVPNELNQVVDGYTPLASRLGVLARDGNLMPLTYRTWSHVPKENKERIWREVKINTDADESMKKFVLASVGKKWREWKARVKQLGYTPFDNDADRLTHRPERVHEHQWRSLVYYWGTRKAQKKSIKNKEIRKKKTLNHITGRKPFSVVRVEETNKKNGVPATRLEVWMAGYTKDNKPSNDKVVAVMTQMKDLGAQSNATDEEIITQVLGPERPGRVRTYGLGPSPTDVFGGGYRQSQEQTRIIQTQVQEQLNQYKAQMEMQMKEMMDAMLNQQKVQMEMQSTIQAQQARIEQLESQQAMGGPVAPAATHVHSQQQSHAYTSSFNCHRSSEEVSSHIKERKEEEEEVDMTNSGLKKKMATPNRCQEQEESMRSGLEECCARYAGLETNHIMSKSDADKLNRRLVRLKSTNRTRERLRRDGFLGLFGHKVDLLDYHEKKLQDLEVNKPY